MSKTEKLPHIDFWRYMVIFPLKFYSENDKVGTHLKLKQFRRSDLLLHSLPAIA